MLSAVGWSRGSCPLIRRAGSLSGYILSAFDVIRDEPPHKIPSRDEVEAELSNKPCAEFPLTLKPESC